MPFTWNQVNTMPDIAATDRYRIFFPAINGTDANILSLLVKSVTLPRKAIGQITVKVMDVSIGFRGGSDSEHTLSVRFHENVRGDGLKNIKKWLKVVRNNDARGELRRTYAGNGRLDIYNTVGATIHSFVLYNMFPFSFDYPELDDSNTSAYEFTVEFNVDLVDTK